MTSAMRDEEPMGGGAPPAESPPMIVLHGEIDARSAAEFADRFLSDPVRSRTGAVDCSDVTFFSAAGLTLLLRIADQRPITVVASPAVARLIEICDLGEILRVT